MKIYLICYISFLALSALVLLGLHIRTLKPVRSVFLHALLGLVALFAVNVTTRFTGVSVPVNLYSVIGSCVFGVPGVCGMLILNLLF